MGLYGAYATDPNAGKRSTLEGIQLDQAIAETSTNVSNQEMSRLKSMARQYNENPTIFTDMEVSWIKKTAPQLGIDISEGLRKDKIKFKDNVGKNLLAGAGGVVDAVLFDLLKDTWYSDRHTKAAKNIGKVAGTVGSLAYGAGLIGGGTKAAKAAMSAKTLAATYGDDALRLADDVAGLTKKAAGIVSTTDDQLNALRAAYRQTSAPLRQINDDIAKMTARAAKSKTPTTIANYKRLIAEKEAARTQLEASLNTINKQASKLTSATKKYQKQMASTIAERTAEAESKRLAQLAQAEVAEQLEKKAAAKSTNMLKRWGMPGAGRGYQSGWANMGQRLASVDAANKGQRMWQQAYAVARPMVPLIARDYAAISAIPRMISKGDPTSLPVEALASAALYPNGQSMVNRYDPEQLPLYFQMIQQQQAAQAAQSVQQR